MSKPSFDISQQIDAPRFCRCPDRRPSREEAFFLDSTGRPCASVPEDRRSVEDTQSFGDLFLVWSRSARSFLQLDVLLVTLGRKAQCANSATGTLRRSAVRGMFRVS